MYIYIWDLHVYIYICIYIYIYKYIDIYINIYPCIMFVLYTTKRAMTETYHNQMRASSADPLSHPVVQTPRSFPSGDVRCQPPSFTRPSTSYIQLSNATLEKHQLSDTVYNLKMEQIITFFLDL